MKVKILKSVGASGFKCKAGEEVEISDQDAEYLIRAGKAQKVEPKKRGRSTKSD